MTLMTNLFITVSFLNYCFSFPFTWIDSRVPATQTPSPPLNPPSSLPPSLNSVPFYPSPNFMPSNLHNFTHSSLPYIPLEINTAHSPPIPPNDPRSSISPSIPSSILSAPSHSPPLPPSAVSPSNLDYLQQLEGLAANLLESEEEMDS